METIAVSALRANLMRILNRVESGSSVTVTSHGRAVAKLVPVDDPMEKARATLDEIRKRASVRDAVSPVFEGGEGPS